MSKTSPPLRKVGALESEVIESLREAVLRHVDPLLVVLFGSQARGTANDDSDIDLLVVDQRPFSPSRSRRRIIGDIRRGIPASKWPVDILLFDSRELDRWRWTTNHVIARALRDGIVLYERSRAR